MAHTITLIPGDGIGPEVTEAVLRILDAAGVAITWERQLAGVAAFERTGQALPAELIASVRRNKIALKGPVGTPIGEGFTSVNVGLRKALDLYSNLRPVWNLPGVAARFQGVDLVIVRENTEDLYAGIEFERGSDGALQIAAAIERAAGVQLREDTGISIKPISETGTRRVVQFAFDYARSTGRRKVTSVHKANIMKHTDGLWLEVSRQVAAENTDVEFEDRIVDNMCMQLVLRPREYDILCCPNLYGDIISDLGAGMIGGLGLAPGANIGTNGAVFEATHGSAPKYAGLNKVNPMAVMLSGVLMLRHLEEVAAADAVEKAIANVIALGENVTYDLKEKRDDPTAVGTSQVADAVIAQLKAAV